MNYDEVISDCRELWNELLIKSVVEMLEDIIDGHGMVDVDIKSDCVILTDAEKKVVVKKEYIILTSGTDRYIVPLSYIASSRIYESLKRLNGWTRKAKEGLNKVIRFVLESDLAKP